MLYQAQLGSGRLAGRVTGLATVGRTVTHGAEADVLPV